MNDDDVLDAVKQTLSGVRMDRPIEAIERRGRARRRRSALVKLAAGGGAAALVAFALTLPASTDRSEPSPTAKTTLAPEAFTLVQQQDKTVKLTLHYKQILDPVALQRALADAGVPAVVQTRGVCFPTRTELPKAEQVMRTEQINFEDGSPREVALVISPDLMPENSRIYFSVFGPLRDGGFAKATHFLVSDSDPMVCKRVPR
ncbi:hypothetical protein SAMN05421812_12462 [Asanoa hainanensis]|uniref:Tat (Twin-arginine translocation) pathway signal sequence n=1 Tax=Asanoa hainanensis TaxID=560556 RepID=A0A239PF45_9ACTN|nr:hypothetical protein [Asanoa hainanensis]SNT65613.1 hypothetical protein SAMN05421812_12462 [Asanoa hainanensis]